MLTEKKFFHFDSLDLECGEVLHNIDLSYETYGQLNKNKDNAILILHALTGDSHLAGKYLESDSKTGWWDKFVGSNKAIDTNEFFVICSNVIGGCSGSIGPSSINPKTNKPYGLSFPFITIKDMVKAQKHLINSLGIQKLVSCIGGSMGGMQAVEWAVTFPSYSLSFIILASSAYQSPQNIALHEVGRRAIMNDINWNNGQYYSAQRPDNGLSIARMIAHITYLSDQSMHHKFGRRIKGKEELNFELHNEFEVESYLEYQGRSFIKRFDANSYLYITRAVDYFDYGDGKLKLALQNKSFQEKVKFLILSFSSDWLYPSYQSLEIVKALQYNNLPVSYADIQSSFGHDAFLLEYEKLSPILKSFINSIK
jgi:homoserine O-acetyltransferase/O-succinyltransferase